MVAIIGFFAGTLTTFAPFLQAVKTVRSKRTHDLSFGMWIAQTTGNALWFTYGCAIHSWPVILANAVTVLCATAVLVVIVANRSSHKGE